MHTESVQRACRLALALSVAVVIAPRVSADEAWYARAALGFDFPATIPDPQPITLTESAPANARETRACAPLLQRWGLYIPVDDVMRLTAMSLIPAHFDSLAASTHHASDSP